MYRAYLLFAHHGLCLQGCSHALHRGLKPLIGCSNRDSYIPFTGIAEVCAWRNEDTRLFEEPACEVAWCKFLGDRCPDVKPCFRCTSGHTYGVAAIHEQVAATAVDSIALLQPGAR